MLFCQVWLAWAGAPRVVYLDGERGFGGYFEEQLIKLDVVVVVLAGEAHTQNAIMERHIQTWK